MKKKYSIVKVDGQERWNVYSLVNSVLQGDHLRQIGKITYSMASGQYTYKEYMFVIYPEGRTAELFLTVGNFLEGLNNE
jgi:hypothetical protein